MSDNKLRFSPNFSVYVLPPNGVCLYAENRKVFLQGQLYCELASRIGAGERPEAIVDALSAHRCTVAPPLSKHALRSSGIGLAAIEIGKAIASGFRNDLNQHAISLDLLGSALVRHYVSVRPQCPACGNGALREAIRAAAPFRLRVGG